VLPDSVQVQLKLQTDENLLMSSVMHVPNEECSKLSSVISNIFEKMKPPECKQFSAPAFNSSEFY
jgi:hypothetical protein